MSNLEILEKDLETLKYGNHLACIYKSKKEQLSVVVPFVRSGLKNNEKCMYIVDENTKGDIIQAFKKAISIEEYLKSGQLEILTKREAYLKDGYFDPEKMIELLRQLEKKALKNGYEGLRVTGEMTWIFTQLPGVERLIEYEASLNYFFPECKCTALCQYNERKFSPEILLDVINTHPKIIIYDTLYENLHFLPPDEFFARMKGEIHWDTYEKAKKNIIHKKKTEERTKQIQQERNLVLDSMSELVLYYGKDKRIKWVNKAAAGLNDGGLQDLTGKFCYEVWHCATEPCEICPVYKVWDSGLYEEGEIVTLDGRIWHAKANPVYENSEMIGVVEVARDITQQKQAEMQLSKLFEASTLISSTMDMDEMYHLVSDSVQKLVGFDNFIIFLVSEDKEIYPAYASGGIRRKVENVGLTYGEGIVGMCIENKEICLLEDAQKDERARKIFGITEAFRSQIVLPLITEGECVGALHISRSTANAYDQHDVAVLELLSGIVASALRNSRLHNQIREFGLELEKRVDEKSRRTEIILDTKHNLQKETSWEKGLKTIVQSVNKLGFETCGIFLVNPMKKTLDFYKDFHFGKEVELPRDRMSVPLKNTEYFGIRCIVEKKTICVKDSASAEGKQIVDTTSFVWVPIIIQDEVVAAISAGNVSENPITDEDIKDLGILAGMCAAFIDRTRISVEPVAEKTLKTELKHWLDTAECYIVTERTPKKSFEIFVDLVTHGVPGFIISRQFPEKVRKKYELRRTPVMWLSRSEMENTLNPDDLHKLNYIIEGFVRKNGGSVILLDGLEYLVTQNSFQAIMTCLYELKDIVVMNNSRLIIPLHKNAVALQEYSILEREFTVLERL